MTARGPVGPATSQPDRVLAWPRSGTGHGVVTHWVTSAGR